MNYFKEGEDHFSFSSLTILVVAVLLTMFSIFYSNWHNNAQITGFQIETSNSFSGGTNYFDIPEDEIIISKNNNPPDSFINELTNSAKTIADSELYVSNIGQIVNSKQIFGEELLRYLETVKEVRESSYEIYKDYLDKSKGYSSKEMDGLLENIAIKISAMDKVLKEIESAITSGAVEKEQKQINEANWAIEREKSVKDSENLLGSFYSERFTPPKDISGDCVGDLCESVCSPPASLIAVGEVSDFGSVGFNSLNGVPCEIPKSEVYVRQATEGSGRNSGQINAPVKDLIIVNVGKGSRNSEGSSGDKIDNGAFIIDRRDESGWPRIHFFSSPNYNDLDEQISKFIDDFFSQSEKNPNYLTGLSVKEVEEIVNKSNAPWVLWRVLFIMVALFLLFGDILSPHYKRLIYFGTSALSKKDYSLAIDNYNRLAHMYPHDFRIRQDILNYLILLKVKIPHRIELEFSSKDSLPLIKVTKSLGIFSSYSRVEKMINHALSDLRKSPKLAKSRMPLIAQEYKKLTYKDREALAPHYESLVYKLKDLYEKE